MFPTKHFCSSLFAQMAQGRRSWEGWAELAQPVESVDDGEFDYSNVSPADAGEELFNFVVCLKLQGLLSAANACKLAFWAHRSGACGPIEQLALRPDSQSGKFSRRFDKVVGTKNLESQLLYELKVARRLRCEAIRRWDGIDVIPPLEALLAEYMDHGPELQRELAMCTSENDLPPAYTEHPKVREAQAAGETVQPLFIFVDGVSYSRTDAALGFWIGFALSARRHLFAVVKKSDCCNCGCKAWCTVDPLWRLTAWSLEHLLKGVHPERRHDLSEFLPSETVRQERAGKRLPFKAIMF